MRPVVGISILALSLLACSREQSTGARATPPDLATPTPAVAPAPPDPNARWACAKDADCTMSCSQGAVNLAWYKRQPPGSECHDGCAGKGMHARCLEGKCVAFDYQNQRADDCTNRPPR
jgi:hypothetical protein